MQITGRIHALKHLFSIPISPELNLPRFVYSFIIFGKDKVHLIDSGVAGSERTIFDYIKEKGRSENEINTLILTHSHPDHIGSANKIKNNSGCKVLAHEAEREWIENIDEQLSVRPVPGFKNLVGGSVQIDQFLIDKEIIELEEGLSVEVIHTPGHSNGSISLYIENDGVLFCGDSVILPGELPIYENIIDTISSVNKLMQISNVKVLLSSWDEQVYSNNILTKMKQSLEYLKTIHKIIRAVPNAIDYPPIELCKIVIEKMNFPSSSINPLVARSFQSNIAVMQSLEF